MLVLSDDHSKLININDLMLNQTVDTNEKGTKRTDSFSSGLGGHSPSNNNILESSMMSSGSKYNKAHKRKQLKEEKKMESEYKNTYFKNRTKHLINILDGILTDTLISRNTIRVVILLLDNLYNLNKE